MSFWKKILAWIKLGIVTKLAYPADFLMGLMILPVMTFVVEALFWAGLLQASHQTTFGGFATPYYIAYLLWLMLPFGSQNYRFERAMIADINTGAVNALLVRPGSFYQFHLGQWLGQKLTSALMTLPIMIGIAYLWDLPFHLDRLPAAMLMGVCYLIGIFSLQFAVISMAFFFDHVYSFNNTKNMILWFLTGELFPLDLLPSPLREYITALPFSCSFYLPAAYVTGRITTEVFLRGFVSLAIGSLAFGLLARIIWLKGLKTYSGTGA